MVDRTECVHVHSQDSVRVIEEYRQKGFVLKERTNPTIVAQVGFVKLIFIPADDPDAPQPEPEPNAKPWWRKLFG